MRLKREIPNPELIDLIRYGVTDAYLFLLLRSHKSDSAKKRLKSLQRMRHTFFLKGKFIDGLTTDNLNRSQLLGKMTNIDDFILELPARSIAVPILPTKLKWAITKMSRGYLIGDLCEDLNNRKLPAQIDCFGRADQKFRAAVVFLNWQYKNNHRKRHTDVLDYIVPSMLLPIDKSEQEFSNSLVEKIRDKDPGLNKWFMRLNEINIWLPFLSLELVNLASSWQEPRKKTVIYSLERLSKVGSNNKTAKHPWGHGYPNDLSRLSIYSLYQFKPDRIMNLILDRLFFMGNTHIYSLRTFHPESIRVMRNRYKGHFKRLYTALN